MILFLSKKSYKSKELRSLIFFALIDKEQYLNKQNAVTITKYVESLKIKDIASDIHNLQTYGSLVPKIIKYF